MAVTVGLLSVFTIWLISVYARGLRLRCGCFGAGGAKISLRTILRKKHLLHYSRLLRPPSGTSYLRCCAGRCSYRWHPWLARIIVPSSDMATGNHCPSYCLCLVAESQQAPIEIRMPTPGTQAMESDLAPRVSLLLLGFTSRLWCDYDYTLVEFSSSFRSSVNFRDSSRLLVRRTLWEYQGSNGAYFITA